MRLLLDTHIAVWAALNPDALTDTERHRLADPDAGLVLSAVVVWELRLKWHSVHISGTRKGPIGPSAIIDFARLMDWDFLPLTADHAAQELTQPLAHKDPFDELLLVQAQREGLLLLTRDTKLLGHPLVVKTRED